MIVSFDAFDRYETPLFHLCNPGARLVNGTLTGQLGILDNTSDEELVANFNAKSELSFRTYKIDYGDEEKNAVFHSLYDAIENRRMLYLENLGFFMIYNVDSTDCDDGVFKDVQAYSCEQEIENKQVPALYDDDIDPATLEEVEYKFIETDTSGNITGGLMYRIISVLPLWSIGHVDETVAAKYRHVDDPGEDTNILSFLLDSVQNAYECIFLFDTTNRIIDVYDQNTYSIDTSIHLTRTDLVNEIKIEESSDDLYTSLVVRGSDGDISIDGMNPLGSSVIYNFSHYLNWMRQSPATAELADKVEAWQEAVEAQMQEGSDTRTYYDVSVDYYDALEGQIDAKADVDLYRMVVDLYTACIENIIAAINNVHLHVYLVADENGSINVSGKSGTYTMFSDAAHTVEVEPVVAEYYYDDIGQQLYAYIMDDSADPDEDVQYFLYPMEDIDADDEDLWQTGGSIFSYDDAAGIDDDLIVPGYYYIDASPGAVVYTTTDVETIRNILAGSVEPTPQEITRYDVNGNGEIDLIDLTIIRTGVMKDGGLIGGDIYKDENHTDKYDPYVEGVIYFDLTPNNPRAFRYDAVDDVLVPVLDIDTLIAMVAVYRDRYSEQLDFAISELEIASENVEQYAAERSVFYSLALNNYFTEEELDVLSQYIFEGTYTDEYVVFTDNMDQAKKFEQLLLMYNRGKDMLTKISQPTYKFTVDVENFAFKSRFAHFTEQLRTGCLINLELAENDVAKLFLTAFTINWDDCTLELTFGNRFNHYDTKSLYQDALGQIQKTANTVAYIREVIDPLRDGTFTQMQSALSVSRNLAKDNALSATNQTVIIDDTGFSAKRVISSGGYSLEQLKITNDAIVLTDDGWKTAKVAIGKLPDGNGGYYYGVNAEVLMGELIVGKDAKLYGELSVYEDETLQTVGGYIGYGTGEWYYSSGSQIEQTKGMILKSPLTRLDNNGMSYGQSYFIVTERGARMTYLLYSSTGSGSKDYNYNSTTNAMELATTAGSGTYELSESNAYVDSGGFAATKIKPLNSLVFQNPSDPSQLFTVNYSWLNSIDGGGGGGGGYVLPMASASALGGVKANAAVAGDTKPVRIDSSGFLFTSADGGGVEPQIIVYANNGVSITVSDGTTTYTGTGTGGAYTFSVNDYGTWTVTGTMNGITETIAVRIDDVRQHTVYFRDLYDFGVLTVSLPIQATAAVYTGSSISPTWTYYSSAALTIGGTTSAVDVGAYTASFTPNGSYVWASDGTQDTKYVIWRIVSSSVDDLSDDDPYITFTADGTVYLSTYHNAKTWDGTVQYSTDRVNWTTWGGTSQIDSGNSNRLYLRGIGNTRFATGESSVSQTQFVLANSGVTGVYCFGNIDALLDYETVAAGNTPSRADYTFKQLFYNAGTLCRAPALPSMTVKSHGYDMMFCGCASLTTAPSLPATTLDTHCYQDMFNGCTSLAAAPELPATTLASYCYRGMFNGCKMLTIAPVLPATILSTYCYELMFNKCMSLTAAPSLPATVLKQSCYSGMFYGCTSLTAAPSLTATELASSCYASMFRECTSLTAAPALPATTLKQSCYSYMFTDCTSLVSPPVLPATTLDTNCYMCMFEGCTALNALPALPATSMLNSCYFGMFRNCTKIKLSETQTGDYQTEYRIPTSLTGTTTASSALTGMFTGTGGSFAGTPSINTTYYTSNAVIS